MRNPSPTAVPAQSNQRSRRHLSHGVEVFGTLIGLVAVVTMASMLLGDLGTRIAAAGAIYLIFVLGLYLYSGTTGVMSFGQLTFALIGAYVGGILSITPATRAVLLPELPAAFVSVFPPPVITPLIAAVVAAIAAVPTGLVLTRLNGVVGSIGTFSLLVIGHEVASNLQSVNGAAGVSGVPIITTLGGVIAWTCVVLALTVALQQSRTGLLLRASREDLVAAQAIGVRVIPSRMVAWTLSAAVSAVGGCLYAQFVGTFTPGSLFLSATVLVIAMLVVGGMASASGAVVGAITLTALYQALLLTEAGLTIGPLSLPSAPGLAEIGLAVLILLVLAKRPAGIMAGRDLTLSRYAARWRLRRRNASEASAVTP